MRKAKIDASLLLIIIMILILAGGVVLAAYTLRSDPVVEALAADRVINVLFVIERDSQPLGSYVLMYYPTNKRAAVFDIAGDLGLLLRRINRVDRIDRVYNHNNIGEFQYAIESLLGIEIGFSLVVSGENLGKMVDLLEGVELFIPARIRITDRNNPVLFPSGLNRLDGDKAALYFQYDSTDEDREMEAFRRQRFFLALLKRLGEKNADLQDAGVEKIFSSLLNTNMNKRIRSRLFDEFAAMDTGRINVQSVGGSMREVSGQVLLLPSFDGNLIKEIVRQTLGSLTRQIEDHMSERVFTVEVLNGTVVNGLAGRTAELLRGFGYDIISIANAEDNDQDKTLIIDRSGYEDAGSTFAGIIRCQNVRVIPRQTDDTENEFILQNTDYQADFTLVIGKDFNGRYITGN